MPRLAPTAISPKPCSLAARNCVSRWKIENETFNCLAHQGCNLKQDFGHGRQGLANLLATLNLFAFALHAVLDCVSDLWRQCRARVGTGRKFFATLGFLTEWLCFHSWTALFETVLRKRPPPPDPGAAAWTPHDATCPAILPATAPSPRGPQRRCLAASP